MMMLVSVKSFLKMVQYHICLTRVFATFGHRTLVHVGPNIKGLLPLDGKVLTYGQTGRTTPGTRCFDFMQTELFLFFSLYGNVNIYIYCLSAAVFIISMELFEAKSTIYIFTRSPNCQCSQMREHCEAWGSPPNP